ncbi:hypothetical protein L873DRAFT_1704006, partial [Choiromyces venosus 120613-1]
IDTYIDSNFVTYLYTCHSFSGYIVLLNCSCISWCSKKQVLVTTLTIKAEDIIILLVVHKSNSS